MRCQTDEANQLVHELCLLASVEERVHACFEEVCCLVNWDDVMECWYQKVLEMPVALNPATLIIFRKSVNLKDFTYKDRMRNWLIESPTIEL